MTNTPRDAQVDGTPPLHATGELERHWQRQTSPTLKFNRGVGQAEISAFERLHGVKLPQDFATYLTRVNGFVTPEAGSWDGLDDLSFEFYPLDKFVPTVASHKYFVFCCCHIFLSPYAICLDPQDAWGQVVSEHGGLYAVASTFSAFVDLYIANAGALYAPGPCLVSPLQPPCDPVKPKRFGRRHPMVKRSPPKVQSS